MNQLDGWRESGTNPENMVLRTGGVCATVGRADNGEWWWTAYDEDERVGTIRCRLGTRHKRRQRKCLMSTDTKRPTTPFCALRLLDGCWLLVAFLYGEREIAL